MPQDPPSPAGDEATIAANLAVVRDRIAGAARAAGRDPAAITLVAVSKTQPAARIAQAVAAGQRVFGENRVQEAAAKWPDLKQTNPDIGLHLIGPLLCPPSTNFILLVPVPLSGEPVDAAWIRQLALMGFVGIALPEKARDEAPRGAVAEVNLLLSVQELFAQLRVSGGLIVRGRAHLNFHRPDPNGALPSDRMIDAPTDRLLPAALTGADRLAATVA